MVFFYF